jgi:hypothetical protein
MSDDRDCEVCGKPMIEDGHTAFYAGCAHWDCKFPNGYTPTETVFDDFREATERVDKALDVLRRRLTK